MANGCANPLASRRSSRPASPTAPSRWSSSRTQKCTPRHYFLPDDRTRAAPRQGVASHVGLERSRRRLPDCPPSVSEYPSVSRKYLTTFSRLCFIVSILFLGHWRKE